MTVLCPLLFWLLVLYEDGMPGAGTVISQIRETSTQAEDNRSISEKNPGHTDSTEQLSSLTLETRSNSPTS